MAEVRQGYMGVAVFGSTSVRCTDFNVNVNQEFGFYDHAIGLNDTSPANSSTKTENIGSVRTQREFVKPNPLTISGSMSLPATVGALNYFYGFIRNGAYINSLTFQYDCGYSRTFTDIRLESFGLDVTSGDILNLTVGFQAKGVSSGGGGVLYQEPEKLITWDIVSIQVNDANFSSNDLLKGFSLDVKNPINHIYTLDPNNTFSDLAPHDLRVGMQEVSGTVTVYTPDGREVLPDCVQPSQASTIKIVAGLGFSKTINAIFLPRKTSGNIGPVVTTVGFVGVDQALSA